MDDRLGALNAGKLKQSEQNDLGDTARLLNLG